MVSLTRIGLAGLLGGLAMMVAAFAIHRPPLDDVGWSDVPGEAQVRAALSASMGNTAGIYVYPAVDTGAETAEAKARTGLIYRPAGQAVSPARAMPEELLKTLLLATLAAALLAQAPRLSYAGRAAFVAAIGFIASISTHISYHAWFGFPASYTAARMAMDFGPWIVGALVIAAVTRARPSTG